MVCIFFSLTCSLVGAGGVFHEHVPGHLFGTRRSPSDHFQRDLLGTGVHLAIGKDKEKREGDSLPTSLFPQIASRLMSAPCACSWRRRRSCRRRKLCLTIFGWFAISFTSSFILWANTDSPQLLLTHIIETVLTHTHNYQPAHPPAQMTKVSHGSGKHFTASAAAQRSACSSRQPMTGSFPGGTISLPEPPLSECTTAPVLSRRRPTQAQLAAFCTRSIILTATAAMAGGTQLFEGAHLTSGNTRFCRESSKCCNYAFFVGQIIRYTLRIILGFGSNRPPSNKNSGSNVPV